MFSVAVAVVFCVYDEIFTDTFFLIDCDIWFMQIYFITRIFPAFDDAFEWVVESRTVNVEKPWKRVKIVNETSESCN